MTIKEISKLTNLSPATISRTLKNPDSVKPHTRDLVLSVLQKEDSIIKKLHILVIDYRDSTSNELVQFILDYLHDEDIEIVLHSSKNSLITEEKILKRIHRLQDNKNSVLLWIPIARPHPDNFFYPDIATIVLYNNGYVKHSGSSIVISDSDFISHACDAIYKGGGQNALVIFDCDVSSSRGNQLQQLYNKYKTEKCSNLNMTFTSSFRTTNWQEFYHELLKQYPKNFDFDSIISHSPTAAYALINFIKHKKLSISKDVSFITFGYDIGLEFISTPISMIYPDAQRIAEHAIFLMTQLGNSPSLSQTLILDLQRYLSGSEKKY